MADVDHRDGELAADGLEIREHALTQPLIEAGERLIHEQDGRGGEEGAAQGNALFLPTAEVMHPTVQERGEFEDFHHLEAGNGAAWSVAELQIGPRIEVREQGEILGDVAHMTLLWGQVPTGRGVIEDATMQLNATCGRAAQTRDDLKQGGFARAGRPKRPVTGAASSTFTSRAKSARGRRRFARTRLMRAVSGG